MKTPLILEIKGNALDDGPGIRSVIFFKGCPLSCTWCHNPESKKIDAEIGFDAEECVGCDTCIATCAQGALSRDNPFFVDRRRCTLCFECAQACPAGALSRVGRVRTVEQVLSAVMPDKPFYDASGGGVTLSGGEPTLFMEYCSALAQALKEKRIHVLLETCGAFDCARFEAQLYPFLDTIYFDIKLIDPDLHLRHCGAPNGRILENFERLHRRAVQGSVPVIPRIPLVPGITATEENIRAVADFLSSCGANQARLLPYHPLWQEKNRKIGIDTKDREKAMRHWLDNRTIEACRSVFREAGINL